MKLIITGGSGQVGRILARAFRGQGDEVVIVSRRAETGDVVWDGKTQQGAWAHALDGSDVVINLAGRSVDCRYTEENLQQMMSSRVDSTRAVGIAIANAERPPKVWLQMSTATIYAHRFDAANDERTGLIGGEEEDAPAYWKRSIDIATAWEGAQADAKTPHTRKVALRTAMVMSPDRGGVFHVLLGMTRKRLGGSIGGGRQYVSWIHEQDLVNSIRFLIDRDDIDGAVNLASPTPLPQREFAADLRAAWGTRVGLPVTAWMAKLGAVFMRTDTELVLKSRRVVPGRLRDAGFSFAFPTWKEAAVELVERARH